jgi:hypothetical protein
MLHKKSRVTASIPYDTEAANKLINTLSFKIQEEYEGLAKGGDYYDLHKFTGEKQSQTESVHSFNSICSIDASAICICGCYEIGMETTWCWLPCRLFCVQNNFMNVAQVRPKRTSYVFAGGEGVHIG